MPTDDLLIKADSLVIRNRNQDADALRREEEGRVHNMEKLAERVRNAPLDAMLGSRWTHKNQCSRCLYSILRMDYTQVCGETREVLNHHRETGQFMR
jgi:hypothetical protein